MAKKNKKECIEKYNWWGKKLTPGHDWAYISDYNRVCDKCGRKELRLGAYSGGEGFEDWRKKK